MRPAARHAHAKLVTAMLGGLAIAAAGLMAVPSGAHAAGGTSGALYVARDVGYDGGCNVTNQNDDLNKPFTSDGASVTATVAGTSTVSDPVEPEDTTTVKNSITGTIKAKESGGQLTSIDLESVVSHSIAADQGLASDCEAQPSTTIGALFETTLSRPRWVTIEGQLPATAVLMIAFQRTVPASPQVIQQVQLLGSIHSRVKAEVQLPAGTYQAQVSLQHILLEREVASDPTSVSVKPSVHLTLADVGAAKGKASGDGKKYLNLDNGRDCGAGTLKAKFTRAAGKAKGKSSKFKKAIFKVNGKKAKVVRSPRKGKKVTLKGLSAADEADVQVVLRFRKGGKTTVTRSYLSCT